MQFKVGDRVVARGTDDFNTYSGIIIDVYAEYLVVRKDNRCGHWACKRLPNGDFASADRMWDNQTVLELEECTVKEIEKLYTNRTNDKKMTTLVEKFRLAITSEPEKTFIEVGIMNSNKDLTEAGKELFIAFLFEKNKDLFKTEVADKLKEEKK